MFHKNKTARNKLFEAIDKQSEFAGAGVVYYSEDACHLLRESRHVTGIPTYILLEETRPVLKPGSPPAPPPPTKNVKSSVLGKELVSAGIACTSAVLAGVAATAGVAAAPVSGGTSTFITVVAGAAAIASAANCGISIGRVINELAEPGSNEAYLDNEEWYQWASNILDAVQLAGVVASAPAAFKGLGQILQMQKTTGKSVAGILKGLSRQERKQIAKELAKASQQLSNKKWKELVRAGKLPKIYSLKAIKATIIEQLLGNVANVLDVWGSARDGNIALIVHVLQE